MSAGLNKKTAITKDPLFSPDSSNLTLIGLFLHPQNLRLIEIPPTTAVEQTHENNSRWLQTYVLHDRIAHHSKVRRNERHNDVHVIFRKDTAVCILWEDQCGDFE